MSFKYDVGVTFRKEDWQEEIYPHLKSLDGTVSSLTGREADTDKILSLAEKIEDDNTITFRWDGYNYWGDDAISDAIENAAGEHEADFISVSEANDVVYNCNLCANQIDLQCPTIRSQDEPYIEQCDRIITKLMQTCMEKGMTVGKLTKALEGVASKEVVKHYAEKAKEQSLAETKGAAR